MQKQVPSRWAQRATCKLTFSQFSRCLPRQKTQNPTPSLDIICGHIFIDRWSAGWNMVEIPWDAKRNQKPARALIGKEIFSKTAKLLFPFTAETIQCGSVKMPIFLEYCSLLSKQTLVCGHTEMHNNGGRKVSESRLTEKRDLKVEDWHGLPGLNSKWAPWLFCSQISCPRCVPSMYRILGFTNTQRTESAMIFLRAWRRKLYFKTEDRSQADEQVSSAAQTLEMPSKCVTPANRLAVFTLFQEPLLHQLKLTQLQWYFSFH